MTDEEKEYITKCWEESPLKVEFKGMARYSCTPNRSLEFYSLDDPDRQKESVTLVDLVKALRDFIRDNDCQIVRITMEVM